MSRIWARCVPEAALTHPPGLPFWSASHLRVERRSPRELDGNPGVSRPPLHRGPAGRAAGFSRGLPVPTPPRHWALCPPGPQRLRPGHRPLGPLGSHLGQVTAQKSYFLSQQRAPYSFRSQGRDEAVMSNTPRARGPRCFLRKGHSEDLQRLRAVGWAPFPG